MKLLALLLLNLSADCLKNKYNILFAKHNKLKNIKSNFFKKILYKQTQQTLREELKYELSEILIEINNFSINEIETTKLSVINYLNMLNNDIKEIELIYIFNIILDKLNTSIAIKKNFNSNISSFFDNDLSDKVSTQNESLENLKNIIKDIAKEIQDKGEIINDLNVKNKQFDEKLLKLSENEPAVTDKLLENKFITDENIQKLENKINELNNILNFNNLNDTFEKFILFFILNSNDKNSNFKIEENSKNIILNFLSNIKNEQIFKINEHFRSPNSKITIENIMLIIILLENIGGNTHDEKNKIIIQNTIQNIKDLLNLNGKNFISFLNDIDAQAEQARELKKIEEKEKENQEKISKEILLQIEKYKENNKESDVEKNSEPANQDEKNIKTNIEVNQNEKEVKSDMENKIESKKNAEVKKDLKSENKNDLNKNDLKIKKNTIKNSIYDEKSNEDDKDEDDDSDNESNEDEDNDDDDSSEDDESDDDEEDEDN